MQPGMAQRFMDPGLCCCCVQGEAIAFNLREMFGIRVPIISVVIGEGGSGGALAIGCANRNLIMENVSLWACRHKSLAGSGAAALACAREAAPRPCRTAA